MMRLRWNILERIFWLDLKNKRQFFFLDNPNYPITITHMKFHEHFFKGKWEPVIMEPQDYDNVVLLERLEDYDLMVAWQDGSCDYVIYKGYYN